MTETTSPTRSATTPLDIGSTGWAERPTTPLPTTRPSLADRLLGRWSDLPPWAVVTQLFFGLGWLRATGEKVISIDWWTGATIETFVAEHQGATLGWFQPTLDAAVGLGSAGLAVGVLATELAIGLGLVLNRGSRPALAAALALNLAFVAIGAVNPSAFYLIGQGALALWMVGRRAATPGLSRALRFTTAAAVALAAVSLPFVATVHPADVIDDPAIMVVLLGGLTALACELTHRARFGRGLP